LTDCPFFVRFSAAHLVPFVRRRGNEISASAKMTIGGVFVVLLCGLAMAIVVAILEFCWNSKRNAQQEKVRNKRAITVIINDDKLESTLPSMARIPTK
jgi:MFS superfamily sulfate permease-like transporter